MSEFNHGNMTYVRTIVSHDIANSQTTEANQFEVWVARDSSVYQVDRHRKMYREMPTDGATPSQWQPET